MVIIEYYQYPVGQGYFHSGKIDNTIWVYDCGTSSKKHFLCSSILNFVKMNKENDKINYLFVSHFHSDHISGIECLHNYKKIDKLVLPEISDEEFILYLAENAYNDNLTEFNFNLINSARENQELSGEVPIIKIKKSEETEFPENGMWIFKPYINSKKLDIANLDGLLTKHDIDLQKTKKGEFFYTKTIKNKLIEFYKDLSHNAKDKFHYTNMCLYTGFRTNDEQTKGYGWLHTGDALLKDEEDKNSFNNYYNCEKEYIKFFSIPHHGSKNNFNEQILPEQKVNCVISSDPHGRYKHPDTETLKKIIQFKKHNIIQINQTDLLLKFTIKPNDKISMCWELIK